MKTKATLRIVSVAIIIIMVLVNSCRTIDKNTTTKEIEIKKEEALFTKIVEQQPKYSTATIKCSVALDKISSKAQIKMINGEYIQISLQPLLGIEMFRIMMTTDSLYVVDKINSLAAKESMAEIKNKLPQGCGIKELQKMILGIPFVVGDTLTTDKSSKFKFSYTQDNGVVMRSNLGDVAAISFNCDLQGVLHNTAIIYKEKEVMGCEYKKHTTVASGKIQPTELSITSNIPQIGTPVSIKLASMTTEWDKKVVKDTNISARYKTVSLQDIIGKYIAH